VVSALLSTAAENPEPSQNPMSADGVRWEYIHRIYEMRGRNTFETRPLNTHHRTLQRILASHAPR
jgi:ActR/RegA family two-component response regulator